MVANKLRARIEARVMLVALGLVASSAGAASTIRDPVSASQHLHRARRTGRIYPEGNYARILRAGLTPAAPDVAAALGAEPGSFVIERQRITYGPDDTPLATSTSYFPADLADQCPALLTNERIAQGTTLYVEQQTGRPAASIAASVACRPGTPAPDGDAEQLQLPPGTCLLALSATTYDADGAALAHEIELHPPDTPITLDVISV